MTFLALLATISPIMTVTYIVLLPATVYLSREVVEKPMSRYRRTAKQHQITATQVVAEAATMITTVKVWRGPNSSLNSTITSSSTRNPKPH